MDRMTIYVYAAIALWNLVVFAIYGIDKRRARKGGRRISESALLFFAFAMGAVGAFIAMQVFRHKTRHIKFKILVPLAVIVNIACQIKIYVV